MSEHKPCPDCGDTNPDNFHKAAIYCKPHIAKRNKDWRIENADTVKEQHRLQARRWRKDNANTYRVSEAQRRQNVRARCIEKLGGKCAWPEGCDWTDPRALQIDHKRGGGNKERKVLKGAMSFYKRVLTDENDTYQLLCANHNAIKKLVNGEYHSKYRSQVVENEPNIVSKS